VSQLFLRPEVDLHVHTVASGHAYSTIGEIAAAAARSGLRGVGMTDHGPLLPGGPHPYHFAALRFVPTSLCGVRIFKGVEANIVAAGKIDLPADTLEQLELVMAGFHEGCGYPGESCAEHTEAVLALMERKIVKIVTHPGNPSFPLDYEAVARKGAETGTALEINNASFSMSRKGSSGNCLEIARLCARFGTPVALGSDAHIADGVGHFDEALATLAAAGIRPEQVVNRTLASTLAFLGLPE
jgi:putative hydrolase